MTMLIAGCGGKSNARPTAKPDEPLTGPAKVKVTVEGWESPSDLGVVVAKTGGLFEDVGRNIWVGVPARPKRPVRYVSEGIDTFGVAQLPQVVVAREKGAPIVAIGSLLSRPTTAMIWLKRSEIHTLADLKGKTIATSGLPYQKRFLAAILARAGLSLGDVHLEPLGYQIVPALLKGEVDAIFGGSWNLEGVTLRERGANPVVRRMQSFGSPSYEELVVITRRNLLAEKPDLVRDFMSAVRRGTATARKDPKAAMTFMKEADEPNPKDDAKVTEAELKATLPLLSKTGRIDRGKAQELVNWMYEQGMIEKPLSASELINNSY